MTSSLVGSWKSEATPKVALTRASSPSSSAHRPSAAAASAAERSAASRAARKATDMSYLMEISEQNHVNMVMKCTGKHIRGRKRVWQQGSLDAWQQSTQLPHALLQQHNAQWQMARRCLIAAAWTEETA